MFLKPALVVAKKRIHEEKHQNQSYSYNLKKNANNTLYYSSILQKVNTVLTKSYIHETAKLTFLRKWTWHKECVDSIHLTWITTMLFDMKKLSWRWVLKSVKVVSKNNNLTLMPLTNHIHPHNMYERRFFFVPKCTFSLCIYNTHHIWNCFEASKRVCLDNIF